MPKFSGTKWTHSKCWHDALKQMQSNECDTWCVPVKQSAWISCLCVSRDWGVYGIAVRPKKLTQQCVLMNPSPNIRMFIKIVRCLWYSCGTWCAVSMLACSSVVCGTHGIWNIQYTKEPRFRNSQCTLY